MPRELSPDEFQALSQRVIQSLPKGLSAEEFQRRYPSDMAAAAAEASNLPQGTFAHAGGWVPPQDEGSATGRFLGGVGSQLNPVTIVGNATHAVAHPIDTAKGLWDAHVEQYQKASQAAKEGRYSEAIGHGVASVVPLLGPAAANAGEQAASGNIAGGVGKGVGMLLPFMAKYGLERTAAPDPRGADLVRREAEQTVSQRVLAPGNPAYKNTAQTIAPEVLSRGMQGNRLQLAQAADEGMASAADAIDKAIDTAKAAKGGMTDTGPIVADLDARIASLSPGGKTIPTAASRVQHLQTLRDYIASLGKSAPFDTLRAARDDFYATADKAKGYQGPDVNVPDVGWAAREAGSAIRSHFAKDIPDLAPANADYTFFKRLGDVLDPTIGRPKNVSASPVGVTGGNSTAGAIVGTALAAGSKIPGLQGVSALMMSRIIPAILEAKNSPAWQLATAAQKMKLADAIEAGDVGLAQSRLVTMLKGGTVLANAQPMPGNDPRSSSPPGTVIDPATGQPLPAERTAMR